MMRMRSFLRLSGCTCQLVLGISQPRHLIQYHTRKPSKIKLGPKLKSSGISSQRSVVALLELPLGQWPRVLPLRQLISTEVYSSTKLSAYATCQFQHTRVEVHNTSHTLKEAKSTLKGVSVRPGFLQRSLEPRCGGSWEFHMEMLYPMSSGSATNLVYISPSTLYENWSNAIEGGGYV